MTHASKSTEGSQARIPKRSISGVKRIIAVGSGKGGVGKSTIAVHLALALASRGQKVGILDADLYGPSVPIILGEDGCNAQFDQHGRWLPVPSWGIHYLSGAAIGPGQPLNWRGPLASKLLYQMLFRTDWGKLDTLVIDLPPGTGDILITLGESVAIDGVVLVTTPERIALADVSKSVGSFRKLGVPILGCVANMAMFTCSSCKSSQLVPGAYAVEDFIETHGLRLLATVPFAWEVRMASERGKPVPTQAVEDMAVELLKC